MRIPSREAASAAVILLALTLAALHPVSAAQPGEARAFRVRPSRPRSYDWGGDWRTGLSQAWEMTSSFLEDHLELRTRWSHVDLDTTSSGTDPNVTFIGSVDELREKQDSSPFNLSVGWYFTRNIGIEYAREEVKARTYTNSEDNHSDGTFCVSGPSLLYVLRLPCDQVLYYATLALTGEADRSRPEYEWAARVVPYVGLGRAFFSADFDARAWWANGYPSPAAWIQAGRPGTVYDGNNREFRVSTDSTDILTYGLAVRVYDNWSIDLNWRKLDVDVELDYYRRNAFQESATIPLDYTATSIGVKYVF